MGSFDTVAMLHMSCGEKRLKCACACYLPGAFGDGAQGHGLFDLSKRQHHSEAGQRGQPRVPHVVIAEVVV